MLLTSITSHITNQQYQLIPHNSNTDLIVGMRYVAEGMVLAVGWLLVGTGHSHIVGLLGPLSSGRY
jgi:hypothetical protein